MTARVLIFAILFGTSALGEEVAQLRYETVLNVVNLSLAEIEGVGGKSIRISTRSKLPEVRSGDIKLTIERTSGSVPLQLDAEGAFDLPISDELAAENPWIRTNQPKGTMVMKFRVRGNLLPVIATFIDGRPSAEYRHFFAVDNLVKNADAVALRIVAETREIQAVTTRFPQPKAVYFIYEGDGSPHAVTILQGKEQQIRSTGDKRFVLEYDETLAKLNPRIVLEPVEGWSWFPEFGPTAEKTRVPPTK